MRILLCAEGPSDELVAESLIFRAYPEAVITKKKLPSRGFPVVRRAIPTCVRASHYQHYDMLVAHFDMNGTLPLSFKTVSESSRWQDAQQRAMDTLNSLENAHRPRGLRVRFMAACQSTDAWLGWGRDGGDSNLWERKIPADLKKYLYGSPPRGIVKKASELIPLLLQRMEEEDDWPRSLREFMHRLADRDSG